MSHSISSQITYCLIELFLKTLFEIDSIELMKERKNLKDARNTFKHIKNNKFIQSLDLVQDQFKFKYSNITNRLYWS